MTQNSDSTTARLVMFERACAALAAVVREEYGDKYSLSDIVDTWGGAWVTPEQLAAVRQLEGEAP